MLQLLHIENIAVIERADISFRAGFNALTGETGAGKSIVIDSLGAVLGARTSRDLIRTGAAKAFVSAEFDGVDASLPVLAALGVEPEDGVLLLQRDIYADGKNICRANGRPITVAQLRALGTSLLNIHGQHEGTQLLDEEQHGAYLDRFARLDGLQEAYTERYQAARETRRQIEALQMDEAEKARRVDTLRHQIAELERAELRDGEEEELLARRELLRNAEKFMDAFAAADYALSGGDDGLGAASQLKNAENALHSVRALGARFSELCERLESLYSDVYDLAETVRDLRSEMDFSPQELDAVESRADQLYRLKKKYGATVGEMLDYLERSKKELDEIPVNDPEAEMPPAVKEDTESGSHSSAEESFSSEADVHTEEASGKADKKKKKNGSDDDPFENDDNDEDNEKDEDKKDLSEKIEFVVGIWESAQRPMLKIFKGFKLKDFYIDFIIADEDAYDCALKYGRYSTLIFNGIAFFSQLITVRLKTVDVRPAFGLSKGRWDTSGKVSFRLGTVVIAGAWFLLTYIFRTFIPEKLRKRKLKKSAARQK